MSEGRAVVLAQASRSCVDWCWSVDCACACVCVWVRACYWQEVQLLTEGLVRARVQASALTDNFPLRGSAHSGDTLRPWPLCLDVRPLLYLTARLYSLCNLIKSCIHLQRASADLCHFMSLFACFPLSQCISIRLFLCTFFDSLIKMPVLKHRKLHYWNIYIYRKRSFHVLRRGKTS